jgi:DNA-binding SARP family transcriptional activator/predicted ATPase
MLHFQLLGAATIGVVEPDKPCAPAAELSPTEIAFPTAKTKALFILLVMHKAALARQTLIELLWPRQTVADARRNLRVTLSRLRGVVGTHLLVQDTTIAFDHQAPYQLDVAQFQALRRQAKPHAALVQAQAVQQALTLYKGEFLHGFSCREELPAFETWLRAEREQLHTLFADATLALTNRALAIGDFALGLDANQRLLAVEPWHEGAHRQQMKLLAASGRRGAALAHYQRCCQTLKDELAVDPARETIQLYEQLLINPNLHAEPQLIEHPAIHVQPTHVQTTQHTFPEQAVTAGDLPIYRSRLLQPLMPLFGRDREMAALRGRLTSRHSRLVTVTGTGGIGKTRLVQEVINLFAAGQHFANGICYVPLADVSTAEIFLAQLAQSLDLSKNPDEAILPQLKKQLFPLDLLLVLDNFEQLLAGTGSTAHLKMTTSVDYLAELLQSAPKLKILVTSRERLKLSYEEIFLLEGLALPASHEPQLSGDSDGPLCDGGDLQAQLAEAKHAPALQLLEQAAQRAMWQFQLTAENVTAASQLCHLLGGMPLAILLAAANLATLSLEQLLATCRQSLDALAATYVDQPSRQHSIRATFDYSWSRLTPTEQEHFQALTLFANEFTADAAQAITGAARQELNRLQEKSLLANMADGRYRLHPLLYAFALEKCTPRTMHSYQQRHAAYYLWWLCQTVGRGSDITPQVLQAVQRELNNIRQAWQWSLANGEWGLIAQSQRALLLCYDAQGRYQEGLDAVSQAIVQLRFAISVTGSERQPADQQRPSLPLLHRALLAGQSFFYIQLGDPDRGIESAKAALESPATTAAQQEDRAAKDNQEEEEQKEELWHLQALAYWAWARALSMQGKDGDAHPKVNQAVALAHKSNDRTLLADTLHLRGNIHYLIYEQRAATEDFQQAYTLYQQLGQQRKEIECLNRLGSTSLGGIKTRMVCFEQALRLSTAINDLLSKHVSACNYYRLAAQTGTYEEGINAVENALSFFVRTDNRWRVIEAHYLLGKIYSLLGLFERACNHFTQALHQSTLMNAGRNQLICLARLGDTHRRLGDVDQALAHMQEAKALAQQLSLAPLAHNMALFIATTLGNAGQLEQSTTMLRPLITTFQLTEFGYQRVEALAAFANLLRLQGSIEEAHAYVDEILPTLALHTGAIYSLSRPFETYLHCYQTLNAARDHRAAAVLHSGYTLLTQWAARVTQATCRTAYLETVVENRELIQAYR